VFGSAALTVFLLQIVTGILLALVYVPSAGEAWSSLQALNHQIALGWFIRAMHGWGSNFMVAIVLIHMVQVFLFGAHKFPRELTWIIGVFLLLMTLGMAFSGQVLRFDQDAYWGLGIGASIASRIPIIGSEVVKLMLGGPIIAGATLSRFFALHVFVIPGMLIALVGLHLLMVLKLGINEWPMPGRIVRRATYERDYHALTKEDGAPFVPNAVWKDLVLAGFIILAIAACAFYFGPFWTDRTAGSDDYPDCSQARLLFPVAVRFAVATSSIDGNAIPSDLPSFGHPCADSSAVSFRRGRKELETPAHCSSYGAADCNYLGNIYAPRAVHTMESAHECVER
jgi:quinol-cytochrome oxidoreductase complex cytochrome b subunit